MSLARSWKREREYIYIYYIHGERERKGEGRGGDEGELSAVPLEWCCRGCSEHNKQVQIPTPETSFLVLIYENYGFEYRSRERIEFFNKRKVNTKQSYVVYIDIDIYIHTHTRREIERRSERYQELNKEKGKQKQEKGIN